MLHAKIKRKLLKDKVTSNGSDRNEKKDLVEDENDSELDEVIFVVITCAFIY